MCVCVRTCTHYLIVLEKSLTGSVANNNRHLALMHLDYSIFLATQVVVHACFRVLWRKDRLSVIPASNILDEITSHLVWWYYLWSIYFGITILLNLWILVMYLTYLNTSFMIYPCLMWAMDTLFTTELQNLLCYSSSFQI